MGSAARKHACGIVLVTPLTLALIRNTYQFGFSTIGETGSSHPVLRYLLALIALGPATILMEATAPVTLTRYLTGTESSLGKGLTGLYVANTMAAVFGASIARFVLIELLGLSGALIVGGSCSAVEDTIVLAMNLVASGTLASDVRIPSVGDLADAASSVILESMSIRVKA